MIENGSVVDARAVSVVVSTAKMTSVSHPGQSALSDYGPI
jgi:hypothetical protein